MSGLSEIDIRDWEKVDIAGANKALDNIDFENSHPPQWEQATVLEKFINAVTALRDKQIHDAQRRIPAILRKIDGIIS